MKLGTVVAIVGILIALVGTVSIAVWLVSRENRPSDATSADPIPPLADADCPNASDSPAGSDVSTGQRPEPYTHTTWLVRGNDGLNLTVERTLLEHASVPEIVRTPTGGLAVYAVDFSEATGANQERLVVITSSDDGVTWTEPQPICLVGKTSTGAAVDPSVVVLPDGRYRLYYFGFGPPVGSESRPDPKTGNKFYSASSDDGVHFTEETGVRFQAQNITDPEVVQRPDGSWLMYISRGSETLIATSPDGLTFTDSGQTISGGGVPGAVVLADGTVRWYGCGQGGLVTATAPDGLAFDARQTVSLTPTPTDPIICDPALVLLPDETFLGVIKTAPSQASHAPLPSREQP